MSVVVLREALNKTIESLTAVVIVLRLFFPCSKPFCVPPGSPKTYFVFSLNSIYHMFSKLFDLVNLASHLIFVKSCPTLSSFFYGQKKSKILRNLFHALLNNPIHKKTDHPPPPQKKKKKKPRGVKIGGGGGGV